MELTAIWNLSPTVILGNTGEYLSGREGSCATLIHANDSSLAYRALKNV